MIADRLDIAADVAAAIRDGRAVVALESTLISHGLPYPENLDVARASETAVRESGAVPATVAIHDGRLLVGLDDAALQSLARAPRGSVRKAARPTLAAAIRGGWAATTVSATMVAAHAAGIRVFATGGIGGIHRGALGGPDTEDGRASFDISSDLEELARTPMAVVCAGPKAILDVAATLEYLETRGVPVVAVGQEDLPGFFSRSSGLAAPLSEPDIAAVAELVTIHFDLGLGAAILVCVPPPEESALPPEVARRAIQQATTEAAIAGIMGPAVTPWLLARIAQITQGASVRANTALIVNDARTAGELAVRLGS